MASNYGTITINWDPKVIPLMERIAENLETTNRLLQENETLITRLFKENLHAETISQDQPL